MLITDIIKTIESIAPLDGAAAWDRSGLQVASHRTEATRVAVALDPTPTSIATALAQGAQFIHTHHPLALTPTLPCRLDSYHSALEQLFKADVALYAAHTSLDVQPDGPAGWLSRELGLIHPQILEVTGEKQGFGLAGDLPQALGFHELLARLSQHISLNTATVSGNIPASISRIAYCTGSGSSLLEEATRSGAQVFITGDVKYHTALSAQICLLDVGHHSLEEEMMHVTSELLARRLAGVEVFFVPSTSPLRRAVES